MNEIEVWLNDASLGPNTLVGYLNRHTSKTGASLRFEYAQAWLDQTCNVEAFALDHELDLVAGAHFAKAGADQCGGIFQDCSPDRETLAASGF